MTASEFQHKYHHYQTYDEVTARQDAALANEEGIEGAFAVSVNLGDWLGWCLMLDTAVGAATEMGILGPENI